MTPKILISGTGRCGTTFLMKLFSFLGFDTGYTKQTYKSQINSISKSGMETKLKTPHRIVKNPAFIEEQYLKHIIQNNIPVQYFIIPIRNYSESAESRSKLPRASGGLWNATDQKTQEEFYNKLMSTFLLYATKHDFNVIYIDFQRMISNKKYLYDKLLPVLKEKTISFEAFCTEYNECSKDAIK